MDMGRMAGQPSSAPRRYEPHWPANYQAVKPAHQIAGYAPLSAGSVDRIFTANNACIIMNIA